MDTGLLWYDGDKKRSLAEKIAQAADRYLHKFGRKPDLCCVNPAQLAGADECDGVRIVPSRTVTKNYLWIGVEQVQ